MSNVSEPEEYCSPLSGLADLPDTYKLYFLTPAYFLESEFYNYNIWKVS